MNEKKLELIFIPNISFIAKTILMKEDSTRRPPATTGISPPLILLNVRFKRMKTFFFNKIVFISYIF